MAPLGGSENTAAVPIEDDDNNQVVKRSSIDVRTLLIETPKNIK